MYQTRISSFFTFGKKMKLRQADAVVNGYRDDDAISRMKKALNSGTDFAYKPRGPFYYLLGGLFGEYRKLIDRIDKKERKENQK